MARASKNELWKPVPNYETGQARTEYRIECLRCPNTDAIVASGYMGRMNPAMVRRKYTARGWLKPDNGKGVCPDCQRREKEAKRSIRVVSDTDPKPQENDMGRPSAHEVIIQAEDPRRLDVDTALLISMKLDDVFDGKVYKQGTGDNTIADELNIPRDWVKQVRIKRFGPTMEEPPEVAALRKEVTRVGAELQKAHEHVAEVRQQLQVYKDEVKRLNAEFDTLLRRANLIYEAVK